MKWGVTSPNEHWEVVSFTGVPSSLRCVGKDSSLGLKPPARLSMNLTQRDIEILEALTLKIRLFTLDQLGRTWWADTKNPIQSARSRLTQLATVGLVDGYSVMAHPELELTEPICVWTLDKADPDFGAVSYQLQSRWKEVPVQTAVFGATKKAGNQFGGVGGRRSRAVETSHGIHMSQVYLFYRENYSEQCAQWISEFEIDPRRTKKHGEKLPDAMIVSDDNVHVIDFGGAYSKSKLSALHDWCLKNKLSYEIW